MSRAKLDLKKRMIREFFSTFNPREKHKKKDVNEFKDEILTKGMIYLQMRLPVERITKEFEDSLIKKIEQNVIQANIRVANESDLNYITELYNKSWLTGNTPFRPIELNTLRTLFQDPDTIILIARVYGRDAGFVIIDLEGDNKEYGVIAGLGVLPRFQRKGLGTVLGMAAWKYIKQNFHNVKELRCEVYKDNQISYQFIKWIGFDEFGKMVYRKEDYLIEEKIE